MSTEVGTYIVEDAFHITGRGWVLAGTLMGQVQRGNQLAFPSGVVVGIKHVDYQILRNSQGERWLLLIQNKFASRQELLDQPIIGAAARVLE